MTDSQPGCSYWPDRQKKTPEPNNDTSFLFTSPQELIPVPVAQQKSRVSRKCGRTEIITSSPYKHELEMAIIKKNKTEKEKEEKTKLKESSNLKLKGKGKGKGKGNKRNQKNNK